MTTTSTDYDVVAGGGPANRDRWSEGLSAGDLHARLRPGRFVDKTAVQAAIGDPRTVTVNALGPQFHRGLEPSRYGRPGRVPGWVNVPAASLADPASKCFISLADAMAGSLPPVSARTSA